MALQIRVAQYVTRYLRGSSRSSAIRLRRGDLFTPAPFTRSIRPTSRQAFTFSDDPARISLASVPTVWLVPTFTAPGSYTPSDIVDVSREWELPWTTYPGFTVESAVGIAPRSRTYPELGYEIRSRILAPPGGTGGPMPEANRRRHDSKLWRWYGRYLAFLSKYYGPFTEAKEVADAFALNPDLTGAVTALAVNEAVDRAYGWRAQRLKEFYQSGYYKLPVGVDAIVGLYRRINRMGF